MFTSLASLWKTVSVEVRERCARCWWPGYAALLAVIMWFTIGPLCSDSAYSPVYWLTVAIHESGHFVTRFWAPDLICTAAGTGFQWGIPVLLGWLLWRQGEAFGFPIALIWLGLSLGMSVHYIADATEMAGTPIWVGNYQPEASDPDSHDWHRMLSAVGMLGTEGVLAILCRIASVITMLCGFAVGGWMVWLMAQKTPVR